MGAIRRVTADPFMIQKHVGVLGMKILRQLGAELFQIMDYFFMSASPNIDHGYAAGQNHVKGDD